MTLTEMPAPQAPPSAYGSNNKLLPSLRLCAAAAGALGVDSANPAYDLSGNLLCDGIAQYATDHEYVYNSSGQLIQVQTQGSPVASYTYSAEGNRVRKDLPSGAFKEYVWLQGQVLSEHSSDGTWTDYIYGNNGKLARVDPVDRVLHMSGVNATVNGQSRASAGTIPLNAATNYVVQAGDVLLYRQWSNNAIGGVQLSFSAGAGMFTTDAWSDTDGQPASADGEQGQWHNRTLQLTGRTPDATGSTITAASIVNDSAAPDGAFDIWIGDVSILSSDGSVHTIYHAQPGIVFNPSALYSSTVSNLRGVSEAAPTSLATTQNETTYYIDDHLGTARLEIAGAGWPVWQGQFSPFGQELFNSASTNSYKFTGQERDLESGQDNFGARYYSSSLGRFNSPDPSGLAYADLAHPQSLNLYSYVMNAPLTSTDPTGLCHEPDTQDPGHYSSADDKGCTDPPDDDGSSGGALPAGSGGPCLSCDAGNAFLNFFKNIGSYLSGITGTEPTDERGDDIPLAANGEDVPNGTQQGSNQRLDYVSIAYWPTGAGGFGHIGIAINSNNTQGFSTADSKKNKLVRLFGAPKGALEFDIAAHTKHGHVAPVFYKHITITSIQAANMNRAINDRNYRGGRYNLIFNNCAQFVESVLHAGGIAGIPHAEIFGPAVLAGVVWAQY